MRMIAAFRRRIAPLVSAVAVAWPLAAASNLLESSPFLPPSSAGGAAAKETAPLELRSILKTGDDYEFSLYDTVKKQSTWARLNEPGHDFVVKAYDTEKETVTIEHQNRTYRLTLKEAKIVPLNMVPGSNQPPMPTIATLGPTPLQGGTRSQPGVAPGVERNLGQTGSPSTLTPEQIRNLEADINRRRELRRQAAASMAQQPQSQSAAPQPQRR